MASRVDQLGETSRALLAVLGLLVIGTIGYVLLGIDLLNWQAFDKAIEQGYQHTLRVLGAEREKLDEQAPLL